MDHRSTDEMVDDYLRAGGKITYCPPSRGTAYLGGYWKGNDPEALKGNLAHLNNPAISEEAFPRREEKSAFSYGELDDPAVLERQMVKEELRALGRLADAD